MLRGVHRLPALVAEWRSSGELKQGRDDIDGAVGILEQHAASASSSVGVIVPCGRGPKRAAVDLGHSLATDAEAAAWRERARVGALVGSAPKSSREAASVLRTWVSFAEAARIKVVLPPAVDDIVAWSTLFKSVAVFRNYLAKLKLACLIRKLDVSW